MYQTKGTDFRQMCLWTYYRIMREPQRKLPNLYDECDFCNFVSILREPQRKSPDLYDECGFCNFVSILLVLGPGGGH